MPRPQDKWMYNSALWKARRLWQLRNHPLCAHCLQRSAITEATIVHHTTPHNGNWEVFLKAPLQSLCKQCHDQHTSTVERTGNIVGCTVDGAPLQVEKKIKQKK